MEKKKNVKKKENKKVVKEKNNKKTTIKKEKKKLKLNNKVRTSLIIILAILLIYASGRIAFHYIDLYRNKKNYEELINDVFIKVPTDDESGERIEINFERLLEINSDVVGWIRMNRNKVNYPFVQSKDNNYYLRRNIEKKYSTPGTIFMDYRNKSLEDQNVVLFGHSMSDKSMFGSLEDLFQKDYFNEEENNYIEIITPENVSLTYQIFSYYIIEKEEYYITPSFKNKNSYQEFISVIKGRSQKKFDVDVNTNSNILTLSTCYGTGDTEMRRVVHAVRIEELEEDISEES